MNITEGEGELYMYNEFIKLNSNIELAIMIFTMLILVVLYRLHNFD
jgi:hypothetical protein